MLKKMKTGSTIKYLMTVILSICSFLLLCGLDWFIYKPELKNADEPFIELSGSIGDSIGNAKNREQQELNAKVTPTPTKPPAKPANEPSNDKNRSNEVKITIEGEKIKINGDYRSINDIRLMTMDIGSATQKYSGTQLDGKKIVLEDDWADYTVYKNVKDIFDKAGIDVKETTNEK